MAQTAARLGITPWQLEQDLATVPGADWWYHRLCAAWQMEVAARPRERKP